MTVKELIDVLKGYEPDAIVHIQHMDIGGYYEETSEVTGVECEDPKKIILL